MALTTKIISGICFTMRYNVVMTTFFTKKKIILTIVLLIVVGGGGYAVFGKKTDTSSILTEVVKQQSLSQTVLATGQVTSATDLALSFKSGGIVSKVSAKVGASVKIGDVLANLEQKDQQAALTQARGSLAQARASLEKVLAGASSEEVKVAQSAVDAAEVTLQNAKRNIDIVKSQQDVLVKNAYVALLNSTPEALANPTNISKPTVTVNGSYSGTKEGTYIITIYQAGNGAKFAVSGLENGDGSVTANIPASIGSSGLYLTFSTTSLYSGDSWSITIPNTKATNYVANQNIHQSALETRKVAIENASSTLNSAQVALAQAEASLQLKKSQARPADVSQAQAQILSAQGQVEAAAANLENTVIRAPADGTVTSVDIKPGEIAAVGKQVVKVQDINNLHIEANISEANISNLKVTQSVEMTFDALGPDLKFTGTLQAIDPASTVVSGVVNYKIITAIEKNDAIKPGMTANLTILVAKKDNVLVIPGRAVITESGKKIVRVISDPVKKTYANVEVVTGLEGDGGLVEIVSGLTKDQQVVTLIKK